jgi:glutamate 5-kinase
VKIGSSLLTDGSTGTLNQPWLAGLCADLAALHQQGKDVLIVTSGAVALGRAALGLTERPRTLTLKQAAAACGQIALTGAYRDALAAHGIATAQVLLTPDDTEQRRRYLNAHATVETLLAHRVIPLFNENDTVATAELRYGDNDRLAARVAQMTSADVLILLSDVDGLYTANPKTDPSARLLPVVERIDPQVEAMAGGSASSVGTGGMTSKLLAAKIATQSGTDMIIASGLHPNPIARLLKGAPHTRFTAQESPANARKRWIVSSLRIKGTLTIDAGAAKALRDGKSLLPAGVTAMDGDFDRGDAVRVQDANGAALAVGLVAYTAAEAAQIISHKSADIEAILGYIRQDELIHRDDLVLTDADRNH